MYIVVEGEDPGFNIFVNGRALARYEGAVERLALELGVRPLLEFFSADESSMALLIEEGAGNPELLKLLEDQVETPRHLVMRQLQIVRQPRIMRQLQIVQLPRIMRLPRELRIMALVQGLPLVACLT